MRRLDYLPRKYPGFQTPHEDFMKQPHLLQNAVVLQT
jgi:hypothetical protein